MSPCRLRPHQGRLGAFIGGLLHERLSAVVQSVFRGTGVLKDSDQRPVRSARFGRTKPAILVPIGKTAVGLRAVGGQDRGGSEVRVGSERRGHRQAERRRGPRRLDLEVTEITTVTAEGRYFNKVIIPTASAWLERGRTPRWRQGLPPLRRRFRLLQSAVGPTRRQSNLALDCARHARISFNSPDLDLDQGVAGRFDPLADGAHAGALVATRGHVRHDSVGFLRLKTWWRQSTNSKRTSIRPQGRPDRDLAFRWQSPRSATWAWRPSMPWAEEWRR